MSKKLTRLFAALAVAAGCLALPTEAEAAGGEKTLGLAGGFSTYNNGGYANLYFQYQIASHVRIAPEIGYMFRNEGKSGFEISADVQFPFKLGRGFGIYPLVGLTLNNWSYHDDGHATRAGFDFGAGFDIYLTSYLKLTLQGKYSLMNDTSGGFFDMGIGYIF